MERTRARDGCIELERSCSSTEATLGGPDSGPFRCHGMRVIALSALSAFIHATLARSAVRELALPWYRQVKASSWASPADVKRDVHSVSILRDGRVLFNIAGSKHRNLVLTNYLYRVVYIRFIGTHRMGDSIDAKSI